MISKQFKDALKLYPIPKYKLAWEIGISPSLLNHLINGHQAVKRGDARLIKLADLIHFPKTKIFK